MEAGEPEVGGGREGKPGVTVSLAFTDVKVIY